MLIIDADGREVSHYRYRKEAIYEKSSCLVQVNDGGYALVGSAIIDNEVFSAALTIRTTANGEVRWREIYDLREDERFTGTSYLFSVTKGYYGSIVAAGYATRAAEDSLGRDGLIMKLVPEVLEPMIIRHVPEDTVLSVLPTDTTQFIVVAEDQLEDSLGYAWFLGDSSLAGDTTVTIEWDELGEYVVQCHVSNDEFTTAVTWHVNVTDFYIDSYSPQNLTIPIRRNSLIDFSVSTRAVEDNPVEYLWLLNRDQIADDDSVSIRFERGREHSVTAVASQGELSDSVTWQVMVNDLIVDYMPERFDLSVPIDTSFEFEVFPFDENDDSLRFLWTVNGDSASSRSWLLKNFDEEGMYNVTAYVSDTTESDSLTWEVSVQPDGVYADIPRHPETTTLQAPTPNPFNSVATVRYYLPTASDVKLSLFDVNGRMVMELVDGYRTVGEHSVVIDGRGLVSGVYFVRMNAADPVKSQKMLLLR